VTSERLVVVANRLPLTLRRSGGGWHAERSAGGLVAALAPVMARRGAGIWLGWPGDAGDASDPARSALLAEWEREHGYVAVDLPARVSRAYYEGYANNTLWPTLHGFPARATIEAETWPAYRDANERFAGALASRHRAGDVVWVHDYQLMLVPELVRRLVPDARIGFFLHVPFPGVDVFRILPERDALLRGLLGADLLAFQTHGHLLDFRRSLLEVLGVGGDMDHVEWDGRQVRLAAHPIGIVTEEWRRLAADDRAVARRVRDLRAGHAGRRLILAVDRLDYTKGIPERLRAFRHLLRRGPELRGRVSLIQVAVPSRERIHAYVELRREVSELVGEINGEFASPEWSPVVYIRRAIPRSELAALYVAADVAWVAPLRDGMNLVAKEYVACQLGGDGVLVLSEFAGAAQEMGEAIRVNPYDEGGSAAAVERALELPVAERRERQGALLARVRRNDALAWSERFLAALAEASAARARDSSRALPRPPLAELLDAAAEAAVRGLYLDYDGTLVPIAERPSDAVPGPDLIEIISGLAADPSNRVAIVSGRPVADLDRWFGDIPGVWLAAEHGGMLRDAPTGQWRLLRVGADAGWKAKVRPILDEFTDRAPGSFVEEKALGLAWHHRLAHPEFGAWLAHELWSVLERQLAGTDLVVVRGRKVVEVRFGWANKGEAIAAVRASGGQPRFELAIGDDRTDEDLFERLPRRAWTIRVGQGGSRARYRVPDPASVLGLLGALVDLPGPVPSLGPRAGRGGPGASCRRAGASSRPDATPERAPRASRFGSRSP
jgi:trehalose 6-phosphate synthase/phosphatase